MDRDADEIPYELMCPISLDLFRDPVKIETGRTYERECIQRQFGLALVCPSTKQRVRSGEMFPDHEMRLKVQKFVRENPALTPARGLVSYPMIHPNALDNLLDALNSNSNSSSDHVSGKKVYIAAQRLRRAVFEAPNGIHLLNRIISDESDINRLTDAVLQLGNMDSNYLCVCAVILDVIKELELTRGMLTRLINPFLESTRSAYDDSLSQLKVGSIVVNLVRRFADKNNGELQVIAESPVVVGIMMNFVMFDLEEAYPEDVKTCLKLIINCLPFLHLTSCGTQYCKLLVTSIRFRFRRLYNSNLFTEVWVKLLAAAYKHSPDVVTRSFQSRNEEAWKSVEMDMVWLARNGSPAVAMEAVDFLQRTNVYSGAFGMSAQAAFDSLTLLDHLDTLRRPGLGDEFRRFIQHSRTALQSFIPHPHPHPH